MWSPVPRRVVLWAQLPVVPEAQSLVRPVKVPQQAQLEA